MQISFPLFAGLIASILHVIMGPDHLAAVIPFAIESKRKAWKIGLFWGIGHIFGMALIGFLFVVFKSMIPLEKISGYSEQLVGLVLIMIGIWAFYKIFKNEPQHKHLHIHSENNPMIHKHPHEHEHNSTHEHLHKKKDKQGLMASFSIGILHGLAGIAHFILFIPILGFENNFDASTYILGFIIGIITAMTIFSMVMGSISSFAKNEHNQTLFKGIRLAGGVFAIIIGIYWMIGN